jgi:hypothetical protein
MTMAATLPVDSVWSPMTKVLLIVAGLASYTRSTEATRQVTTSRRDEMTRGPHKTIGRQLDMQQPACTTRGQEGSAR